MSKWVGGEEGRTQYRLNSSKKERKGLEEAEDGGVKKKFFTEEGKAAKRLAGPIKRRVRNSFIVYTRYPNQQLISVRKKLISPRISLTKERSVE